MNRPTERAIEQSIDFNNHLINFLSLLSAEELAVCALLEDGLNPMEIVKEFECSKRTVYGRIERAREVASLVFGRESIEGRRVNRPNPFKERY